MGQRDRQKGKAFQPDKKTTTRTPTTDTKRLIATRASIKDSIDKDFSAGTQRLTDIDAAGNGPDGKTTGRNRAACS
jgi:hypothetical protein